MLLTIEIEVWWKYIYIYKLKMSLTWFIRKDGNIWGGREFMTWHYWIRSWLYFCEKQPASCGVGNFPDFICYDILKRLHKEYSFNREICLTGMHAMYTIRVNTIPVFLKQHSIDGEISRIFDALWDRIQLQKVSFTNFSVLFRLK